MRFCLISDFLRKEEALIQTRNDAPLTKASFGNSLEVKSARLGVTRTGLLTK